MDLEPFKQLIRTHCRLNFKPDSFLYLAEAVQARMRVNDFTDAAVYLDHLSRNRHEISHLINLLTNNETYFLRESGHYRLLTGRLFPELLKRRPRIGQPVKIISAGCASGEEPYSLALSLMEHFGEGVLDQIRIVGLDIDEEALHQAAMAVYGPYSFRGVDPALRDRYFSGFLGNRYVLNETIRSRVTFLCHNLVTWPYPAETAEADLVFYRNVSIYYQTETQREILQNLGRLLAPQGYLVMGAVEIGQHDVGDLHLCREGDIFFFSKATPPESLRAPSKISKAQARPLAPDRKSPPPAKPKTRRTGPVFEADVPVPEEALMEEAVSLAQANRFEDALSKVDGLMQIHPGWPTAYGLKAVLLMHLNRVPEAEGVCREVLVHNEWSLEAYLLLGLAAQQRLEHAEAVERFKKAVYLDPACWLAHYHLADCYAATGHPEAAQREYAVTLKLLEKSGLNHHGLPFFPLSYNVDQMAQICRSQMERLEQHQG